MPTRSRYKRRTRVRFPALGAGCTPSFSSLASTKASIGFFTQAEDLTRGGFPFTGFSKGQRHSDDLPALEGGSSRIHSAIRAISKSLRVLPIGIFGDNSPLSIRISG